MRATHRSEKGTSSSTVDFRNSRATAVVFRTPSRPLRLESELRTETSRGGIERFREFLLSRLGDDLSLCLRSEGSGGNSETISTAIDRGEERRIEVDEKETERRRVPFTATDSTKLD